MKQAIAVEAAEKDTGRSILPGGPVDLHKRTACSVTHPDRRLKVAKLRHVAIKCDDLHWASKFYSALFEMEEVGRAGDVDKLGAVYLSDGTVSIALIKVGPDHVNGKPEALNHIGFVVPDMDSAVQRAKSLGVETLVDPGAENASVTWETKMRTPDGVYFDFSTHGWPGISGVDS